MLNALNPGTQHRPPLPRARPKAELAAPSLWVHLIASNYSILPHPPAGEGLSEDPGVKGRGLGLYRSSKLVYFVAVFYSSTKRGICNF